MKFGNVLDLNDQFNFNISQYSDSSFVGTMFFEVKINGVIGNTQRILCFTTPESPFIINKSDINILDGRLAIFQCFHKD